MTNMSLNFQGCDRITEISAIGDGIKELENMTTMTLNFARCANIYQLCASADLDFLLGALASKA